MVLTDTKICCFFSFYVGGRLYWGTDRLFLVERALGLHGAEPERLMYPQTAGTARLTFFFDYSSPWANVGCMRLQRVLEGVAPVRVEVEWVPILLGALFKQIGTPIVRIALWDGRVLPVMMVCSTVGSTCCIE